MKINRFLSSYLKAVDVPNPVAIKIEKIVPEQLGHDGETKEILALYYEGGAQRVVLNKTMLRQLADILRSEETEHWIGKQVVMFCDDDVWYQGKKVGGIRFRPLSAPKREPAKRRVELAAPEEDGSQEGVF